MTNPIMVAGVASIVSVLLTFTVTSIAYQRVIKNTVSEGMTNHEKQFHQDSMYEYIEKEIDKHESKCPVTREIVVVGSKVDRLEKAVFFLVEKQGGNLRDLGLVG